jgi:hypothetical protein
MDKYTPILPTITINLGKKLVTNNTIVPYPNTHSGEWFILELLGVSAGVFFLASHP